MRPDAARRTAGKTIALRRLAQPWTLILVVTGLFQFSRGAPLDGAFFLGIAILLLADAVGWLPRTALPQPRATWLLVAGIPLGIALVLAPRHGIVEGIIVTGIGVSALLLGWSPRTGPDAPSGTHEHDTREHGMHSHDRHSHDAYRHDACRSDSTEPATSDPDTSGRGTSRPGTAWTGPMSPAMRRAAILWSIIAVACCLWEVASFLLGLPSPEAAVQHPSISALFDPVIDTIQGRIAFTALWLLVGVALLRGRGRRVR